MYWAIVIEPKNVVKIPKNKKIILNYIYQNTFFCLIELEFRLTIEYSTYNNTNK